MEKKITLKRMFHHGNWRLLFVCNWDNELVSVIRTIKGSNYSKTFRYWYADDNEETLKQIFKSFRDIASIDISELTGISHPEMAGADTNKASKQIIEPRADDPVEKKIEKVKATEKPVKKINERRFDPVEIRLNVEEGKLAIKFTGIYNRDWVEEIKSFSRVKYDEANNEYLLPWSVTTGDSISDYLTSQGADVKVFKVKAPEAVSSARREIGDEIRSRPLGERAKEGLTLMRDHLDEIRYSKRTNESYLALLDLFFRYYNEKDPLKITGKEVSAFLQDFIIANEYSASYQNQMISAIKTFYKISGKGHFSFRVFERPKRSRALPKVFSKDEVKRILNATKNDKHKLILWMIYSCGLRRTEITNICLKDLDRERNLLHIREGKGRVDRIVPVSQKVWEKLDAYIDSYSPVKYLFEGQGGGKYSSESVYRVFKTAMEHAGIKRDVGVHSLRHSYATHLHESGLDIRYIQELLGHKSTRTTEIYTHVSRRNLVSVRSPIEDLDVK